MICIEFVQIDVFGIKGRVRDTILDLAADAVGILTALGVIWCLGKIIGS